MEFLFTGQWASMEAILVLICVGIFIAIFSYDGYVFLRQFLRVFFPKKPTVTIPEGTDISDKNQEEENKIIEEFQAPEISIGQPAESMIEEASIPETTETIEVTKAAEPTESYTEEPAPQVEPTEVNPLEERIEEVPESVPEERNGEIPESIAIENITGDAIVPEEVAPEEQEEIQNEIIPPEQEETIEEDIVPPPSQEAEDTISAVTEDIAIEAVAPIETAVPQRDEIRDTTFEMPAQRIPTKSANPEALFALINNVRTLIARGQTLEARGLIIQGLALEKDNCELNVMLAGLYEQDRHFEKAEYIYKDLALMYPNDTEILEKLGNVLIIERRYEIASEMYKKILSLNGETEGTLYILAHLANEMKEYETSYSYSKKYLKQWPNNPEILTLLSTAEVALGKRQDAIQTLIKLKNLTPYNNDIALTIQKLVMEEELASNFGEEK